MICYFIIMYACYKMFKNYEMILENDERLVDAREDIIERNYTQMIDNARKNHQYILTSESDD